MMAKQQQLKQIAFHVNKWLFELLQSNMLKE